MGIPYSREINSAFEQVTPLVAAAYEVLQTTKNIAILLAVVQITTVVLLTLILVCLLGLLYTMNPDLETERKQLVTPVMRWLTSMIYEFGETGKWFLRAWAVLSSVGLGIFLWRGSLVGARTPGEERQGNEDKDSNGQKDETSDKSSQDSEKKPDEK